MASEQHPCPVCGRYVPVLATRDHTYARHMDMRSLTECVGGGRPHNGS